MGAHVGTGDAIESDVEEDNVDAHVVEKGPEAEKGTG